jgi:hypothetical protein
VKFLSTKTTRILLVRYIGEAAVLTRGKQYRVALWPFPRETVTLFWNGDKNENDQIDVRGTCPVRVGPFSPGIGWRRPWPSWASSPAWWGLWGIWAGARNGIAGLRSGLLQQPGTRLSSRLRLSAGCRSTRQLWISARCRGSPCTAAGIHPAAMVALGTRG